MIMDAMECSICMCWFDTTKHCLRLLQCGHTFCTECIESLLQTNQLKCPLDNKEFLVTAVNDLPKIFALLDVIEASTVDCQICEEENHPASHKCLDCDEYMCEIMMKAHKKIKVSRDHAVFSLAELHKNPNLKSQVRFCQEHGNEQFRYYDTECKKVICRDCFALEHTGHKCVALSKAAEDVKSEIKDMISSTVKLQENAEKAEVGLVELRGKLDLNYQCNRKDIKDIFEKLHRELLAKEDALLNQVDKRQERDFKIISKSQDDLKAFLDFVKSNIQKADEFLSCSSDATIMIEKDDTISTISALKDQHPIESSYYVPPLVELAIDYKSTIESIQKFDVLFKDSSKYHNGHGC